MTDIKRWETGGHFVEIDLDLCVAAAECLNVCPADVYDLVDGKVVAENIGECIACMACQDACPEKAILKHSAW